ncbi:MAG: hypothetical protein ACKPCM_20420 [Pseudanabaena sp.]
MEAQASRIPCGFLVQGVSPETWFKALSETFVKVGFVVIKKEIAKNNSEPSNLVVKFVTENNPYIFSINYSCYKVANEIQVDCCPEIRVVQEPTNHDSTIRNEYLAAFEKAEKRAFEMLNQDYQKSSNGTRILFINRLSK